MVYIYKCLFHVDLVFLSDCVDVTGLLLFDAVLFN